MNWQNGFRMVAVASLLGWLSGCNSAPSGPPPDALPESVHDHDDHGHDHGHDHAHAHGHPETGPNGGHLVEFETEEFHAEWLHDDDSGKLTIFILDGPAKAVVPISADHVTIEKTIGDKTESYQLAATDRPAGETKGAKFEIVDKPLIEALKTAGQGVEARLTVDIEGRTFAGKFEHQDHGHSHGHKH
ncbi:MAG: hypothetical protein AB7F89_04395 [Pirellulaceae bacterium]